MVVVVAVDDGCVDVVVIGIFVLIVVHVLEAGCMTSIIVVAVVAASGGCCCSLFTVMLLFAVVVDDDVEGIAERMRCFLCF